MWLDDYLRQNLLYSGMRQPTMTPFIQDALAPQGGADPRAMENGTPDFNTLGAKADVLGAKGIGFLSNPQNLAKMGLMGMYAASGGRSPGVNLGLNAMMMQGLARRRRGLLDSFLL